MQIPHHMHKETAHERGYVTCSVTVALLVDARMGMMEPSIPNPHRPVSCPVLNILVIHVGPL